VSPKRRIKRPTPPQGEATDAGVRDDAGGDDETVRLRAPVDVSEQRAASDPHAPRDRLDDHVVERPEIDHEPAVDGREPGQRVAAAADGDRQPVLAAVGDRGDDVLRRFAPRDQRRPAVVHRVPDRARRVVVRRAGPDHASLEAGDDLLLHRAHGLTASPR